MRARTTICPRCKVREKLPGKRGYCRECAREIVRERRARLAAGTQKQCPICGNPVERFHQYCPACSALSPQKRAEIKEIQKDKQRSGERFAALKREAAQVNWRYAYGCGIVSKQPEPPPPEKRELSLSDFVGRDNEPSIFQHL